MKKNIFSLVALVLVGAMLLAGCGAQDEAATQEYEQQIAALMQENEVLRGQIDVLTAQLESLQSAVLKDWDLTARASQDRSSATVSFSAVPAKASEEQTVSLIVMLNGFEAESILCALDGETYYGSVELPGADGYSYYCIITGANGSQQQIPLVTADNGANDSLVNLSTSLSAYCNLFVEDWGYADGKLTVSAGFIQAQMPTLSADGASVTVQTADLVLNHNGQEVSRVQVFLNEGEAAGSYEASVSDVSFEVPELEDDHQLDVLLLITLTDGSSISYNGCSWYYVDGELNPVMG